jgi:hypothetical protein
MRQICFLVRLLTFTLAVMAGLTLGTVAQADSSINVYTNLTSYTLGQTAPQISVSGASTAATTVDVHIGLVAPNGTIYEYPNWNTSLQPWIPGQALPAGFSYPITPIFSLSSFPGNMTPGTWQAAAAFTKPGTLDVVAVKTVNITVLASPTPQNNIGVSLSKSSVVQGQGTPDVSLSASSTTGALVDVYLTVTAPNGTTYDFPNWNTNHQPWLSGYTLPANFNYPSSQVTNLNGIPGGLTTGAWTVSATLKQAGTSTVLGTQSAQFQVTAASAGGSQLGYGSVALYRMQSSTGTTTSASGGFYRISGNSQTELQNYYAAQNPEPNLGQCVFSQGFSPTNYPNIASQSLDAGDHISLSSIQSGATNLPRSATGGLYYYAPAGGTLAANFYQNAASYTFQGVGGTDVGAFSVTLNAPMPLGLIQPAADVSGNATQSAASNLNLVWNGNGGTGEVQAVLVGTNLTTYSAYTIYCRFPDSGTGTIPANLLTQLKNGVGAAPNLPGGFSIPNTYLNVSRYSYTTFQASGLDEGYAVISSGSSLSLNLQ